MELEFYELCKKYNEINNSFEKSVIFHVGIEAGFHSEVDAMMLCMIYCYQQRIKFILYADDANFTGGRGWSEFFESFCEENHDDWNRVANRRKNPSIMHIIDLIKTKYYSKKLKKKYNIDYLTQDLFSRCIDRSIIEKEKINWDLFQINGNVIKEFGKLSAIALKYNEKTEKEIDEMISLINLPNDYISIQFRGGDKIQEYDRLMDAKIICEKIDEKKINISNLFIFTDDYRYIQEVKRYRPQWKIYTLTREDERGYNNVEFNKKDWKQKRRDMIKLFSMIEICLKSRIHLGCEQTCVNNYIKSLKGSSEYIAIQEG